MILFECLTGEPLKYASEDGTYSEYGYYSMIDDLAKRYLKSFWTSKYKRYLTKIDISLLCHLLEPCESKRCNTHDIITHKWFSTYCKKYQERIWRKSKSQTQDLLAQKEKMAVFPYYSRESPDATDDETESEHNK